ncbi:MAG: F0F1 ATP synthase subunit gamma [Candidatus Omnitrophica bacterium]|nr:F0F1 ATP synthase subunit gamma [Candidatus Omnitrophota bacterium]
MQSVQKLKKELQLNTELTDLLDVLKGIASSEFRALERNKERFAKFLNAFEGFFQMIDFSLAEHPFARDRSGKLGIIMVTSDEGFMGGLNTKVINAALNYDGADKAALIIIGERGAGYLKGLGRAFTPFPGVKADSCYESALGLKDFIMKEGLAGTFSKLMLIYPRPVSFTMQKIEILKLLPCGELFEKQGAIHGAVDGKQDLFTEKVIIESSLSGIIEYLVSAWIAEKLYEVFEDSKLSEFSARTVHLEESYQLLLERGKSIGFQYFRSHHDLVDKGMRETFSARMISKKG